MWDIELGRPSDSSIVCNAVAEPSLVVFVVSISHKHGYRVLEYERPRQYNWWSIAQI